MRKYIKYTYFNEDKESIAIIHRFTPSQIIQEFNNKYDKVLFEED